MTEAIAVIFVIVGTLFMLLAAVGVARMPDTFMRMQANSKAATLGVGCVFIGVAIHFGELSITARALTVIVFMFLTAPVAGHAIGRAAYLAREPLFKGTVIDELQGCYDPETYELSSTPLPQSEQKRKPENDADQQQPPASDSDPR